MLMRVKSNKVFGRAKNLFEKAHGEIAKAIELAQDEQTVLSSKQQTIIGKQDRLQEKISKLEDKKGEITKTVGDMEILLHNISKITSEKL